MSAPLAVLTISGIAPDRFLRIQQDAARELGEPLSGNSGTIQAKGAEVSFAYDGNSLTFNILKVPSIFGYRLISPEGMQSKLMDWVDGVA